MTAKIRTRTPPERLKRRALLVVALVVPAIAGAIALPRMLVVSDGLTDSEPLPDAILHSIPMDAERARQTTEPEAAPVRDPNAPHAGGDLAVSISLRRTSIPTGRAVKARVALRNLSLDTVHVPAPSEPQTTLRIVVVDEQGEAVRDIVETAADPMPRRTRRIASGDELTWDVDVVAPGEAPLPPGSYRLVAVFDTAPEWLRTGLPMWRAPAGAIRAQQIRLDVTE